MHTASSSTLRDEAERPTPPAVLVDIGRQWERAQASARARKVLTYALGSVLLAVVVVTALYSAFVYLSFLGSTPEPSPEELAAFARSILLRGCQLAGATAALLALVGLVNNAWMRFRVEPALARVRDEAQRNGWNAALVRCGGRLDLDHAQSLWERFRTVNRRFVIGYAIAVIAGAALAVIGFVLL